MRGGPAPPARWKPASPASERESDVGAAGCWLVHETETVQGRRWFSDRSVGKAKATFTFKPFHFERAISRLLTLGFRLLHKELTPLYT